MFGSIFHRSERFRDETKVTLENLAGGDATSWDPDATVRKSQANANRPERNCPIQVATAQRGCQPLVPHPTGFGFCHHPCCMCMAMLCRPPFGPSCRPGPYRSKHLLSHAPMPHVSAWQEEEYNGGVPHSKREIESSSSASRLSAASTAHSDRNYTSHGDGNTEGGPLYTHGLYSYGLAR